VISHKAISDFTGTAEPPAMAPGFLAVFSEPGSEVSLEEFQGRLYSD
jgi:hypothetical protein